MASGAAVEEEMAADGDTEKAAEDPEAVASGAAVGEGMAADDDTEKAAEDPEEEKFITIDLCKTYSRDIWSRYTKTIGMQPLSPRGGGHLGHTLFGLCQARTYLSAQECSRDGATACFFLARSSTLVYT